MGASAAGAGSGPTPSLPRPTSPASAPSGVSTRTPLVTFRQLQQQGLTPGEAASLTAFMCGLPTADLRWSLVQINHLLFLQRLYQLGRFGTGEGGHHRLN